MYDISEAAVGVIRTKVCCCVILFEQRSLLFQLLPGLVWYQLHTNKALIIDVRCRNVSSGRGSGSDTNIHAQTIQETLSHCCLVSVWRPCPSKGHYWPMQSRALIQFVSNVTYGSFHSHLSPLKSSELWKMQLTPHVSACHPPPPPTHTHICSVHSANACSKSGSFTAKPQLFFTHTLWFVCLLTDCTCARMPTLL